MNGDLTINDTSQSTGATIAESKSKTAYDVIRDRILSQQYTPGYRLVMDALARELDMSAVPIREAVRQLEAEGLVTFVRNVGAHVAMTDDSDYRDSMQTLGVIEGALTALNAQHLSAGDLAEARELNRRMIDSLEEFDPATFTRLNQEFHLLLCSGADNERLLELVQTEWRRLEHLRVSTFSFVPRRARQSVAEHEALLDLIEANVSSEDIERAARHHRWATLDAFLEHEKRTRHGSAPSQTPTQHTLNGAE